MLQSWYQGAILYSRHTRGISEAVIIFLVVTMLVLGAGLASGNTIGLYVGLAALSASTAAQTAWLWRQARRPWVC